MDSSISKPLDAEATEIWFDEDKMYVRLKDGREVAVPLEWFPRLRKASKEKLEKYRLIGDGEGIHWPDLDEDLLVSALLTG